MAFKRIGTGLGESMIIRHRLGNVQDIPKNHCTVPLDSPPGSGVLTRNSGNIPRLHTYLSGNGAFLPFGICLEFA
jgi:hypothetical protein